MQRKQKRGKWCRMRSLKGQLRPSAAPHSAFSAWSSKFSQSVGRAKKYHLVSHVALLAFDVDGAGALATAAKESPPKPNLTI